MKKIALSVLFTTAFGSTALAQYEPAPTGQPPAEAQPAPSPVPPPPAPAVQILPLPLPPAPPPQVPPAHLVPPPEPIAGYTNGGFFLRDPHDWFVLFPRGRLQIDWYNFLNRGSLPAGTDNNSSKDPRPKDTLFVRRARVEMQGTFIGHFDFAIGGEFGSVPATGAYGTLTDCFINVDYLSFLKLQAGQFDAPFTLENRTSDKYFDFMERSVPVRAFGVPSNKEDGAMLWGWVPKRVAYYSIGVFNGDGQSFKNQDNNPAVIGRGFIAPLAWMPAAQRNLWLADIWLGASFWWQRSTNLGGAAAPSTGAAQNDVPNMTTQGGVTFFSSNWANGTDMNGNTIRSHLAPYGDTTKWALEANIPIKWLGLRWEFVNQSAQLAQYDDTVNAPAAALKRSGPMRGAKLDGYSTYVEVFGWILGDVNFLETPGLEPLPKMKKFTVAKEPRWGLMLAAKYEHTDFSLSGLPMTAAGTVNPAQGSYKVDTFELGLNGWGTKHVRVTANYLFNYFSGDAKNITTNFFYHKLEQELLFRLAVAL